MKKGFTLAEVLITLGIIGVIAALTLPTLITQYKKQVYVNQLKKVFNTATNGCIMALAQNGVTDFRQTDLWDALGANDECTNNGYCNNRGDYFGARENAADIVRKYFDAEVTTVIGTGSDRSGNEHPSHSINMKFKDGSTTELGFAYEGGIMFNEVDLDGAQKGPNKYGYDIFTFYLDQNCKPRNAYADVCLKDPDFDDEHCFTRILEDGWQIKYY